MNLNHHKVTTCWCIVACGRGRLLSISRLWWTTISLLKIWTTKIRLLIINKCWIHCIANDYSCDTVLPMVTAVTVKNLVLDQTVYFTKCALKQRFVINYPREFLNSKEPPGLLTHCLSLKLATIFMFLHNLDPPSWAMEQD